MIDLVPELLVKNIEKSLIFWCDTCLFQLRYERLDEGFAYIEKRNAQLMLDEIGKNWITGELTYPLGRGINFQITVDSISLNAQFLVQDPDGYLIRFSEYLGERAIVL